MEHEHQIVIEKACCRTPDSDGLWSCGCRGQDSYTCVAAGCPGITEAEADDLDFFMVVDEEPADLSGATEGAR